MRRREFLEHSHEIDPDIRIGILLDGERGRGVTHKDRHQAGVGAERLEPLRDLARDLVETLAAGLDRQHVIGLHEFSHAPSDRDPFP